MTPPTDHPPILPPRIGVLLTNLGTPDGADVASVKRYLKQFLSDRRVVEIAPIIWQPILRGIVLNTRPRRSSEAYQQVWTADGSPLAAITKAQCQALQGAFGADVMIDWAMRYGTPSIPDRLAALQAAGCQRVLVAPLYPQYCSATTGSANQQVFETLATLRWQPALRTLPPYYAAPAHIDALRRAVETGLAALDFVPDAIVTSFHGMPARTLFLGDPYHCQCQVTARLLGEALGRPVIVTFQSRFGRAKWLEPATDETLVALPGQGVRKVAVIAPGFAADCLETLEELAIRGKESFIEAGGTDFAYLPCLNDSATGIAMLRDLLARELEGWINPA